MQGNITTAVLGGFILIMALGFPVWARADADEAQLETVSNDIDKTIPLGQNTQVQVLARQFDVAPGVVEGLRARKQGWGETAIELAMAQRLAQTDPKTYPNMTDALNKIESLRGQKMGWGKIARNLGFKLGPVVSVAKHARNELRRETYLEKSQTAQKTKSAGKPEKASMDESIGRPEHVGRPRQDHVGTRADGVDEADAPRE